MNSSDALSPSNQLMQLPRIGKIHCQFYRTLLHPVNMNNKFVVVLKLVASCRWNCGLDKLSTILRMKILRRQPTGHAAAYNIYLYKSNSLSVHSFHYLLSSHMDINFIRVSPTGYVRSTQPLTYNKELKDNLLEASTITNANL